MKDIEELTKEYVESRLGHEVLVDEERVIISYEHNIGRLAIYSLGEERFIRVLKPGDKIIFVKEGTKLLYPHRHIKE